MCLRTPWKSGEQDVCHALRLQVHCWHGNQESLRNQTFKIRFTTPFAFCGGVDANGDTWVNRRTQTYCTTLMSFLILLLLANQRSCFCTLNVFTPILFPSQCHLKCGSLSALLLRAPFCVDRGINGAKEPAGPHMCTRAPQTAWPSSNRSLSCFWGR